VEGLFGLMGLSEDLCACFQQDCWQEFFRNCCDCCSPFHGGSGTPFRNTETVPFWEFEKEVKKRTVKSAIRKLLKKIKFIHVEEED
jgi:hypothetical protein